MTQSNGRSPGRTGLRSQAGNANPTTNLVPPNGNQPQLAGNQNINPSIPINLQPNVNIKVDGTGLDTFVPVIPEVRTQAIKELFKVRYLTKLEGKPTHDWLETIKKELGKCSFGGGKSGYLGTVYNNTSFRAKTGHD